MDSDPSASRNGDTRVERDSMGEMEVPAAALYGASTQRAVINFPISGQRMPRRFLRSLALIKLAAAETNQGLGLLDAAKAQAIAAAAREVADGRHDAQFPIDVYQTGSGTSTNTNMNEVVAHLAAARLGSKVHPNDDVNRCQSSNDAIPTALQLSGAVAIEEELIPALIGLQGALAAKADEFWGIVKTGRTHLQDATPIRLGQEFAGYAGQVEEAIRRAQAARDELLTVPLGGTAVGTGINAHPEFAARACQRLSELTGLPGPRGTQPLPRPGDARRRHRRARRHPLDRAGPVEDRLRHPADGHGPARGPRRARAARDPAGLVDHAGQGEPGHRREPDDGRRAGRGQRRDDRLRADRLPARAQRDAAGDRGDPARVDRAARGVGARTSGCAWSTGVAATDRGPALVEQGLMLATALAPEIGYDAAAALAKEALKSGRTIRELATERGIAPDRLDELLDPASMTEPGLGGGPAGG